jgi:hypothetical protein
MNERIIINMPAFLKAQCGPAEIHLIADSKVDSLGSRIVSDRPKHSVSGVSVLRSFAELPLSDRSWPY